MYTKEAWIECMAMPAFEDVILKKQWVPTHMVRIMLVCMPVTLQSYIQNKEKTTCTNVKITWLFYVEALQLYKSQTSDGILFYFQLFDLRELLKPILDTIQKKLK